MDDLSTLTDEELLARCDGQPLATMQEWSRYVMEYWRRHPHQCWKDPAHFECAQKRIVDLERALHNLLLYEIKQAKHLSDLQGSAGWRNPIPEECDAETMLGFDRDPERYVHFKDDVISGKIAPLPWP